METKQTAVEFFEEMIHFHCLINDTEDVMIDYNTLDELFIKAKAMEKEQIEKAYKSGCIGEVFELNCNHSSEQYYNETYGK